MADLDDPKRLAHFRGDLMSAAPDEILNECVREAAKLADAPLASITFVMGRVQYFRASVGLPKELAISRATSRCDSFCQFVVTDEKPFIVKDASSDVRVPKAMVDLYGVGAYLGVPVFMGSEVLGALCVVDVRPRDWGAALACDLAALSDRVTRKLTELTEGAKERARGSMPGSAEEASGIAAELVAEARAFERALLEVSPLIRLANGLHEGAIDQEAFARGARALHEAAALFEEMLVAAHGISGKSERIRRFIATRPR